MSRLKSLLLRYVTLATFGISSVLGCGGEKSEIFSPPNNQGEVLEEIVRTNSNGEANFGSNVGVKAYDNESKKPINNLDVVWQSGPGFEAFLFDGSNYKGVKVYSHNSWHEVYLEKIKEDYVSWITSELEEVGAWVNFLKYYINKADCKVGDQRYVGTYTGDEYYNGFTHLVDVGLFLLETATGSPYISQISTLNGSFNLAGKSLEGALGMSESEIKENNWDKYWMDVSDLIPFDIVFTKPSQKPELSNFIVAVDGGSVNVNWSFSDLPLENNPYYTGYSGMMDLTGECKGYGSICSYKLNSGSWLACSSPLKLTLNPGDYDIWLKVKDKVDNETIGKKSFKVGGGKGVVIVNTYRHTGTGYVKGLAWDGDNLWSGAYDLVFKHDYDMRILKTYEVHDGCEGLAWGGDNLWTSHSDGKVYKYDRNIDILEEYEVTNSLEGLAWDGENIWGSNRYDKIYKYNSKMGLLNEYLTPYNYCEGLAWDGLKLWGCDAHGKSNKIYQFDSNMHVIFECEGVGNDNLMGGLEWANNYLWVGTSKSNDIFGYIYKCKIE